MSYKLIKNIYHHKTIKPKPQQMSHKILLVSFECFTETGKEQSEKIPS